MSQPASPNDGLPTLGTVPLGPDEPQLFTEAMERIIRHLGEAKGSPRGNGMIGLPIRQAGHSD
jgi:hypothetical protein